jgi:hypothetical protein
VGRSVVGNNVNGAALGLEVLGATLGTCDGFFEGEFVGEFVSKQL